MEKGLKQCSKCKKVKNIDSSFYLRDGKPSSQCKECIRQRMRRYRADNPEKCRERNKMWYLKNIEKMRKYDKKRRELHPEYNRNNSRRWRKECKDKASYGSIKNGARARNLEFNITYEEYLDFFNKPCVYCGRPNQSGLDRVDNERGYVIGNIVTCCKDCNVMKWSMSIEEFLNRVEIIYKRKEHIRRQVDIDYKDGVFNK